MKILKAKLPENSLLNVTHEKYSFVDSFQGIINDRCDKITSTHIGKSFFSSSPKWMEKLLLIRNKIVTPFGLKTSLNIEDKENMIKKFKCKKGEQLGLFKVFDKTENEVILGEDDAHLNFRVSLFLENHPNEPNQKKITISTTVKFNNWFGAIYFFAIKHFHKLIVPAMLKGIIHDLEKNMYKELPQ